MKKVVLVILVAFSFYSNMYAQVPLKYEDVIPVQNTSKEELFKRAEKCMVLLYQNSAKSVEVKDEANGQVTVKYKIDYKPSYLRGSAVTEGPIEFVVNIFVRDGRYKILISDILYNPSSIQLRGIVTSDTICPPDKIDKWAVKWSHNAWKDMRLAVDKQVAWLVQEIKSTMSIETEPAKKDW